MKNKDAFAEYEAILKAEFSRIAVPHQPPESPLRYLKGLFYF